MAQKKEETTAKLTVKEKLSKLAKEKKDYLAKIEKQEDDLKKTIKADLLAQIKQKKAELDKLEKDLAALSSSKQKTAAGTRTRKAKPDVIETAAKKAPKRGVKKAATKKSVSRVMKPYSDDEIKGVLEGLDQGITDTDVIRKTYLPGRRKPSIEKLIAACRNTASKDIAEIRKKI